MTWHDEGGLWLLRTEHGAILATVVKRGLWWRVRVLSTGAIIDRPTLMAAQSEAERAVRTR